MRNMSFMHTSQQIEDQSKTVTRRMGWKNLKAGTLLQPVKRIRGLLKGSHPEVIGCPIRVVSVRKERLDAITEDELVKEGFHDATVSEFLALFCKAMNCKPSVSVTRIEFEFVTPIKEK